MKNISYQLYSTSGNPTAIIPGQYFGAIKNNINKLVFKTNPKVEQIGYLYQKNKLSYFEMMGNEFSGNGCRAAGYSLLKGKNGKISFNVKGIKKQITVFLKNKVSSLPLPFCFDKTKIINNDFGFLIKMFDSLIFVFKEKVNKSKIRKIIDAYQYQKAVGIMFISVSSNNVVSLNPYFYVKKTNTLINETSCGSGSIAAGIYLSWKNKMSFSCLEIKQPSKESIFFSSIWENKNINNLSISGKITKLGCYQIDFPSLPSKNN